MDQNKSSENQGRKRQDSVQLTVHAAQRLQQRGIPHKTLALLLAYGRRVYDHRGGCTLAFDKSARRRITNDLGKAAAQLKLSARLVLEAGGHRAITAYHGDRRIREAA